MYISLSSFLSFGQEYVEGYYKKSGNAVFLHIFREKIEIPGSNDDTAAAAADGPEKKITRLAIGVEGGFNPNEGKRKYDYKNHLNIVVFPDAVKIPYPNIDLPLLVSTFNIDCTTKTKYYMCGIIVGKQFGGSNFGSRIDDIEIGKRFVDRHMGW